MTGRRSSTDAVALRSAYDALKRGEIPRALELVAHDIDWHDETATSGEPRRGRESFEQYLRSWFESFEEFRIHPEHIFPQGEHLIAIVRQTGRGRISGAEIAIRIAHVWTVEDHRAIRWRSYPNLEQAVAAHDEAEKPPG